MPGHYTFPHAHRLRSAADYSAVYEAKMRASRGPLTIYGRPNAFGHLRMGMSVSRKVGMAVKRNRIRRLLREAYRHSRHDLPGGYDLVIVVRPHEPMSLAEYQIFLSDCVGRLHEKWRAQSNERQDIESSGQKTEGSNP